MNEYPDSVKEKLTSIIRKMSKSPSLFVKNPKTDFTRSRKLPFGTIMKVLICMGGNSVCKELLESQNYDLHTATASAFIQQRDKLLPSAFEFLFREFTSTMDNPQYYKGYRLFAADGSDLHTATNPNDADTYHQINSDIKGYNLLNLNVLYDLCSKLYVDANVQAHRNANEHKALTTMIGRYADTERVVLIADRGYEGYNNFAHIEQKGWNYLIRVKDLGRNGILSGLSLCSQLPPDGEFDVRIQQTLTRKQTNEVKAHPEIYHVIPTNSTFDFLDLRINKFYPISFRVVRFKITEDSYETVITNLNESEFPPYELKELYSKRWGVETSFRELKYSVGLVNFHAKKREHIIQEIFARLTMYNFSTMITSHVIIRQHDTRYTYQVNFTAAIHICRYFLRLCPHAPPPDVEAVIRKNVLPVRPGRADKRKIRYKTPVSFIYRVT